MFDDSYKTIAKPAEGNYSEKRSKFLAYAFPVQNEQEVKQRLAEIQKKHWDARHHCYAYILGPHKDAYRLNDNGEPSGTAGKPILEVINGAGLTNVLIIVTRYFGGVLLGTGGLVRAYTQSAQAGLAASEIGVMTYAQKLTLTVGYNMINNVQYYLSQNEIPIADSRYEADVQFDICVRESDISRITDGLTQKCEGQITIIEGDKGYYCIN